jgi:hypothetical protein
VEVAEGGDEVVAVDDVGRDLAADDLHEDGVVGHGRVYGSEGARTTAGA